MQWIGRNDPMVVWWKRLGILVGIYALLDVAYVVKSAEGIDLLPPSLGHHGWMFVGSDWAISKLVPNWPNYH